jgi:hypothetical protein
VLIIIATLAVTLVLPAAVAGWLAGGQAVLAVVLGEMGALAGATRSGWRRMARVLPVLGVATVLAALAGFGWGWVAVMAVVGAAAGAGLSRGYGPALLFSAMPAVFMLDGLDVGRAVLVGVFALLAGAIGVLLARHLGVPDATPRPPDRDHLEWLFAPVGLALLGGGAAVAVGSGIPHGYWIVLTLIIVGAAMAAGDTHRNRDRLAGNLGGLAITIPLSFVPMPAWAFYVVAFVLLVVSFTFITKRYWLYALLESAAVVLLVSAGQAGSAIIETGEARAGATVIGCAMVGVLVVGLRHLLPHIPRVNAPGAVDA